MIKGGKFMVNKIVAILILSSISFFVLEFPTYKSHSADFQFNCFEVQTSHSVDEGTVVSKSCYEFSGLPSAKLGAAKESCTNDSATGYERTWSDGSCPKENRVASCLDPFFLKLPYGASSVVYRYYEGWNPQAATAHCKTLKGKSEEG
jgi:hypothetical protein